jgi:hypothetical protein
MSIIYMKHPALGNKYFPAAEQTEREAAGWVKWPRTKAQKDGVPVAIEEAPLQESAGDEPAPIKRGPGRPKKG